MNRVVFSLAYDQGTSYIILSARFALLPLLPPGLGSLFLRDTVK